MRTLRLSAPLHAVVAEHLTGEFATAGVTLEDGSTLLLINIGPFQSAGPITGDLFGDEPCSFDQADVREVVLTVLDPQMMGDAELTELGIVESAEATSRRSSSWNA